MNRGQKITMAVSVVIVAGLVAVAAPPLVSAAGWAMDRMTPARDRAPESTEQGTEPHDAATANDLPGDLPEGYVSVGHGTFVPAGGPGDCEGTAWIHILGGDETGYTAELGGTPLVDTGQREFATGLVGHDPEGRIATYTVGAGDAPYAIGDRFCIGNATTLLTLNGHDGGTAFRPGEVIVLDPDAVPGFEFDYPYD